MLLAVGFPSLAFGASGNITQSIGTDANGKITSINIQAVLLSDATSSYESGAYGGCACYTYAKARYLLDGGYTGREYQCEWGWMNNAYGQYDDLGQTRGIYSVNRFQSNQYWNLVMQLSQVTFGCDRICHSYRLCWPAHTKGGQHEPDPSFRRFPENPKRVRQAI
ncbi:MAG: hypothetical protein ABIL58_27620 [Pseudomonadota bacterium]